MSRAQKRVKVTAKLSSPVLNLTSFLPELAAPGAAKPAPCAARLIPDTPLPLDLLRAIDADLDLQVQQLKFGEAQPLGPILVRAVIVDGRLRADPVQVTVLPGQVLSVTGTIDASQRKNAAWVLNVDGAGIDLGEFLARVGRGGTVTGGPTNFTLNLTGRGNNLRALLGGMNGTVRASVGPAQLHQSTAAMGTGLFRGLFNVVNPFRAIDPDTSVTCLGLRTPVRDGLITLDRNLAIETAKFNVVVSGTINLRTLRPTAGAPKAAKPARSALGVPPGQRRATGTPSSRHKEHRCIRLPGRSVRISHSPVPWLVALRKACTDPMSTAKPGTPLSATVGGCGCASDRRPLLAGSAVNRPACRPRVFHAGVSRG